MELKNLEEIQVLFEKFDEDGSGLMEVDELFEMFRSNGIEISYD